MIWKNRWLFNACACVVPVLALQACGDDDPTPPPNDSLEAAEIRALAVGLTTLGALSGDAGTPAADSTVACPLDGDVQFSGRILPDPADNQVLRVDVKMVPDDCTLPIAGSVFALDGAPDVRLQGTVTSTGFLEPIVLDFDVTGGVNWRVATPARSGVCRLDLDLDGRIEWPTAPDTVPTLNGTLAGMFCDTQIDVPLTRISGVG